MTVQYTCHFGVYKARQKTIVHKEKNEENDSLNGP